MTREDCTFCFVDDQDIPAILALFRESYGFEIDAATYRWQFFEAPLGGGRSVVAMIDGDPVSHIGYTPRACRIAGRTGFVLAKHTTMTHPDWRRRGIYSCLMTWAHEQFAAGSVDLVLSWPNAMNHRVQVAREDYVDIRQIAALRRMTESGARAYVPPPFPPAPDSFSDEHNSLCSHVAGEAGFCYVRSAEYLAWRYSKRPDVDYFVVEEKAGGKLESAVIFKFYPASEPIRIMVAEWLCEPDSKDSARPFDALEDYAQDIGLPIHLWHNVHDRLRHRLLEKRGYTLAEPILYFGAFPLKPESQLHGFQDWRNWYTTMGDVDVF